MAEIERVDHYTIRVNGQDIRADDAQERRIRLMTPDQLEHFLRIMGAVR